MDGGGREGGGEGVASRGRPYSCSRSKCESAYLVGRIRLGGRGGVDRLVLVPIVVRPRVIFVINPPPRGRSATWMGTERSTGTTSSTSVTFWFVRSRTPKAPLCTWCRPRTIAASTVSTPSMLASFTSIGNLRTLSTSFSTEDSSLSFEFCWSPLTSRKSLSPAFLGPIPCSSGRRTGNSQRTPS